MQVDTKDIKEILIKLKEESFTLLDHKMTNKVRSIIDSRIGIIDTLLIWLSKSEQKGAIMSDITLGKLTTWEPVKKEGSIDQRIIEESKALKKNYDAIQVNVETISWNTLQNRTYTLRKEGKIKNNIVPRKDENGVPHLVYLDPPPSKRSRTKETAQ